MPVDESSGAESALVRDQLLEAASRVFYQEGIHSSGVDKILREAGVTRTTLYRYFAGKNGLVEAYLDHEDSVIRGYFSAADAEATSPRHRLELIVAGIADDATRYHTRGCPFINAAAEYPDPAGSVRRRVATHRNWFKGALEAALVQAGADDPAERARTLVLLRDAALVGSYLDDRDQVRQTFLRAARQAALLD